MSKNEIAREVRLPAHLIGAPLGVLWGALQVERHPKSVKEKILQHIREEEIIRKIPHRPYNKPWSDD